MRIMIAVHGQGPNAVVVDVRPLDLVDLIAHWHRVKKSVPDLAELVLKSRAKWYCVDEDASDVLRSEPLLAFDELVPEGAEHVHGVKMVVFGRGVYWQGFDSFNETCVHSRHLSLAYIQGLVTAVEELGVAVTEVG